MINDLGAEYVAMGGTAGDRDKKHVLLKGLLKDFEPVVTKIQLDPAAKTFVDEVWAYAKYKGLENLCTGGLGAATTEKVFFTQNDNQCHMWQRNGTCNLEARTVKRCRFNHGDKPGSGKDNNNGPKCTYCGKKNHKAEECKARLTLDERIEKEVRE